VGMMLRQLQVLYG